MKAFLNLKELKWSKKHILLIALVITIFAELIMYNWNFWLTRGNNPLNDVHISYGDGITVNEDGTLHVNPNNGAMSIEISDINVPVNFIKFDAQWVDEDISAKPVHFRIYAKDAGNAVYTYFPDRYTTKWNEASRYVRLFLSGNVPSIKINLLPTNEKIMDNLEADLKCSSIVINPKRPLMISAFRVLFVFGACVILLVCVPCFGFWEYKVSKGNRWQILIFAAVVLGEILISLALIKCVGYPDYNEPYNKLATAISEGHFYINDIPDEKLVNLSNPYDTELRWKEKVPFKWDFAYFEGHYYVYYGVAPAVLVFLPYQLITGKEYYGYADNWIPSVLFIIGIAMLVRLITCRYYKKMPYILSVLMQLVLTFGSYSYITSAHPDFYSLPRIYALLFTVWGLYFWCLSLEEERIKLIPVALGSLCIALISGTRPQLLIVMLLAFPLFWNYGMQLMSKDAELRKRRIKECLAFMIPFIVVAALMMYYNYARFGSVFDFGANYNLTTNDMRQRGFSFARVPAGLFIYFMQMPVWKMQFPFLEFAPYPDTIYQGINIIEITAGGLFTCNLLALACFGAFGDVLKGKKKVIAVMCNVFVLVIVAVDTMMSGILPYYYTDFAIFALIAALMVIAQLYENGKLENKYSKLLIVLLSAQIVVYHLLLVIGLSNLPNESPNIFYKIAQLCQPFIY